MQGYLYPPMSRTGWAAWVLGRSRSGLLGQTSHSAFLARDSQRTFPTAVCSPKATRSGGLESWLWGFSRVSVITQEQGVEDQELSDSQEKRPPQLACELERVLMQF